MLNRIWETLQGEAIEAIHRTASRAVDELHDAFRTPKSLAQTLSECGFTHIAADNSSVMQARWKNQPITLIAQPGNHLELRAYLPVRFTQAELQQPAVVALTVGLLARNHLSTVAWMLAGNNPNGPFHVACKLMALEATVNTIKIAAETIVTEMDESGPLINSLLN